MLLVPGPLVQGHWCRASLLPVEDTASVHIQALMSTSPDRKSATARSLGLAGATQPRSRQCAVGRLVEAVKIHVMDSASVRGSFNLDLTQSVS